MLKGDQCKRAIWMLKGAKHKTCADCFLTHRCFQLIGGWVMERSTVPKSYQQYSMNSLASNKDCFWVLRPQFHPQSSPIPVLYRKASAVSFLEITTPRKQLMKRSSLRVSNLFWRPHAYGGSFHEHLRGLSSMYTHAMEKLWIRLDFLLVAHWLAVGALIPPNSPPCKKLSSSIF